MKTHTRSQSVKTQKGTHREKSHLVELQKVGRRVTSVVHVDAVIVILEQTCTCEELVTHLGQQSSTHLLCFFLFSKNPKGEKGRNE